METQEKRQFCSAGISSSVVLVHILSGYVTVKGHSQEVSQG
jgi:hypothetical protein